MSILSVNCRGLGNTSAVDNLRNLVRREAPSLIFLMETKFSSGEMMKVRAKFPGYDGLAVDSCRRSGGVALFWLKGIEVNLQSMSIHHMDVLLKLGTSNVVWRLTRFYGWSEVHNRHLSWRLLEDLARQSDEAWVCIGDFNEILFESEKKGGRDRALWQMENFREAIDVCHLCDVHAEGYEFTYDNGQIDEDNVQCRLDRALVTQSWKDLFPKAKLYNLEREWSDHAPLRFVLEDGGGGVISKEKLFRFEQVWTESETCENVVGDAWLIGGDSVAKKLEVCAEYLKTWSEKEFGKVFREIRKKRRKLSRLNRGGRAAAQVCERRKIVKEISALLHVEVYWRQRSRVLWLAAGDRNSSFFHRKANQRRQKNVINSLVTEDGERRDDTEGVCEIAVDYF
ncbi:uncharacterized protein LOC110713405 [Chenopodium quinoa]|uniref:uncharacterized protein LOC110713405 n=1 Tax=Chenopodium quinoa TaxID=63459 RepID=UPI000B7742C0|nr:uncharacterized protein LOC110713405 [Chenopodium quinoa]